MTYKNIRKWVGSGAAIVAIFGFIFCIVDLKVENAKFQNRVADLQGKVNELKSELEGIRGSYRKLIISMVTGDKVGIKEIALFLPEEEVKNVEERVLRSEGWLSYSDKGANIRLPSVKGKIGNALQINYDFTSGVWVGVYKMPPIDFSKANSIKFIYRGEGNANTVEVKLEDADGTNYGKLLDTKSNVGSWTTVEIPISNFTYWWGGDEELALSGLKLHFAISIKGNDEGGSGIVIIDQIELLE